MLDVTHLECERGDRRLISNLGFSLNSGEVLHVSGANGSGKTTLLRTLCGLSRPSNGVIKWDGHDIRELGDEYHREVTYLGHLPGVKDELTGLENLRFIGKMAGFGPGSGAGTEQMAAAMVQMGLAGYEELPAKVLSQGQRRRLSLARLILGGSRLWILDEPLTALDVAAIDTLQALFNAHLAAGGLLILSTHQPVELNAAGTKQLVLGK